MKDFIKNKKEELLSPWISLSSKEVVFSHLEASEIYHSLALADYVSIIPITTSAEIVLVEQYRPAVEKMTLELPGGILDDGEIPGECAVRELYEETGYRINSELTYLGKYQTDTGRLENNLHGFVAHVVKDNLPENPEKGVQVQKVKLSALRNMILTQKFNHSLHISLLGIAMMRGFINLTDS